MITHCIELKDESATLKLGAMLAAAIKGHNAGMTTVFLEGDLGMGKTTLSRGILQALGHVGHVKSPTYTLVEQYPLDGMEVCHFDLYRLVDPEELEYIGGRDFFAPPAKPESRLCLVEWPAQGAGFLPAPDLVVALSTHHEGRRADIEVNSSALEQVLRKQIEGMNLQQNAHQGGQH